MSGICKANYSNFYDISVPRIHHYFANGLIHHNTGKTFSGCLKLHAACSLNTGLPVLLVRKTYHSLVGTAAITFQRVTEGTGVRNYGGETPTRFIYPNGSVVWLGGLDHADDFLSGEYAIAYFNQAEETTQEDWETVLSRCTGRGTSYKTPQIIGDANPSSKRHWILERAARGTLRLLKSVHQDNPELFDAYGKITEEGKRRIGRLDQNLTGVRRDRLLRGLWVSAEGAVFPMFNVDIHVRERDEKEMSEWFLCQDQGFSNPSVILLVGKDYDGRWHVFREYYRRGALEVDVVKTAAEWFREKQCTCDAVDNASPGLIAALINNGVNAIGGKGKINEGIYSIQNRLKVCADGKPRITISRDCKDTINEFESHVWKPSTSGLPTDTPLDRDNHSVASLRYLEDVLGTGTGAFSNSRWF